MATEIIMPKAGMAMETGTIIRWLKQPGDTIETGEAILEIETDKVSMEVEAESSGVLLGIIHDAGAEVPVTEAIGYIGQAGEAMPQGDSRSAAPSKPTAAPETVPAPAREAQPSAVAPTLAGVAGKTPATPAAKRLAAEHRVDLAAVAHATGRSPVNAEAVTSFVATAGGSGATRASSLARQAATDSGVPIGGVYGSGSSGRVLRQDINEQGAALIDMLAGIGGFVPPADYQVEVSDSDTTESLSGIRKVTAQRMVTSHLTAPPTTLHREVVADRLIAFKQEFRDAGQQISLNDLLLAATARALRACPWMCVSLADNTVIKRGAVHLGMAVASERGLLVPVIRDADKRTIGDLHDTAKDLALRARAGKLGLDELQGAVFSVSNLGMYGITTFTPIVNPPEAGILGVGTVRTVLERKPDGSIGERSNIDLSLTVDHRLIDGAQGALFLQQLADLIEHPVRIVV